MPLRPLPPPWGHALHKNNTINDYTKEHAHKDTCVYVYIYIYICVYVKLILTSSPSVCLESWRVIRRATSVKLHRTDHIHIYIQTHVYMYIDIHVEKAKTKERRDGGWRRRRSEG